MKRPSTRFFITLGLTSVVTSVLLFGMFAGVIPDRQAAQREGRAALAESLAAATTVFIQQGDLARIEATLGFVVDRNEDLLTAGLRTRDGRLVSAFGDHDVQWRAALASMSTEANVQVPIFSGGNRWGTLELHFEPLSHGGILSTLFDPRVRMIAIVGLVCFGAFYLYLGRVLRQLDPSTAVPARVRHALDTMAEGLLVLDPKGTVVLANQALSLVLGRTPETIAGRSVGELPFLDPAGNAVTAQESPWHLAQTTGVTQRNVRLRLTDATGRVRSFLVNCSPVIGGGSKPGGVLVSLDDVTELEEKEIALRVARDEAEAANRAKSEFLANMSHEIRTPMNAVLGFTELLRRGYHRNDAEMRRHLDTIHSSGTHLLLLINDVLDLAKVESGRMELERVPCAAHVIAQEVISVLGGRAIEKNLTLRLTCATPMPDQVVADPTRLRQILTNLVGNAVKFTERGGVTLSMAFDSGAPAAPLRFIVTDTGKGIAPERIDAIFEPFTQADAATARQHNGTGLGLTISRDLARAMGGDITVRSVPGRGSVFTVSIDPGPLEDVNWIEPDEAVRRVTPEPLMTGMRWSFPGGRVLVVDDGDANRELVRLVLEPAGVAVEEAENGRIAVDKAMAGNFDLVLMDMQMPVMDGYEATRRLRELGCPTPVYAMTADAMKGFETELMNAGCAGFVTKPIDVDLLLQTIAPVLRGTQVPVRPVLKNTAERPLTVVVSEGEEKPVSVRSRLHDHPRLAMVAKSFVDQLPSRVEAIRQAYRERDFETLASLGHWLKGSGGTAGFDVFTAPAKTMEQLARSGQEAELAQVVEELLDLVGRVEAPETEPREQGVGSAG